MANPWAAGQPYELFMGRWSRLVAHAFVEWLAPRPGLRWLDLGCGTGALSRTILEHAAPAAVLGVDPSATFIAYAQQTLTDPRLSFAVGDAQKLPAAARDMQMAVSGLALNFIPAPAAALRALAAALQPEGMIALYVWDYAGKMEMLRYFWDSAVALDPQAAALDEGVRFPICRPEMLQQLFGDAGLQQIEVAALDVATPFADFADYWSPFLGGQGPAPGYVAGMESAERQKLSEHLRVALPMRADGSIHLVARAWAVRATI